MFHMPVTWTHQDAAFSGVDVWTRPNSGNHNLRRVNHSASPRVSLPPVVASKFSSSISGSPVKVTLTIAASSQLPALVSHSSKGWPSYRTFKGPRAPSTLNSGQSSRDPSGRFTNTPNLFHLISSRMDTVTQPDGTSQLLRMALEILPSSRDSLQFHARLNRVSH